MTNPSWTIRGLRAALDRGQVHPLDLANQAFASANQNWGHNTYLWQDAAWTRAETSRIANLPHGPLWGLPISVKDCFDLATSPTTCGVHFYRELHGPASHDSWLVEQIRAAGAIVIGKTHLHPLAYGITGENPEYGDCLQPRDASALTGGSSSGAAASIQEGSAVAAIGTDTGGSVRAPAALCGLAGYRATLGRGNWRGGAHLAQSFDTMGWLFRDLEDAPLLAAPFAPESAAPVQEFKTFAVIHPSFLHDCEPEIISSLNATVRELESLGLRATTFSADWWADSREIFAPIQAWEAARLHEGHFSHFEPAIRERLEWGTRITDSEISSLRQRHADFRAGVDQLIAAHSLLLLPSIPVIRLIAGADHSQTRSRLLRYTTPFSLAGVPVVTIPCTSGGMQLAAARGNDESLLHLAGSLGALRNRAFSPHRP